MIVDAEALHAFGQPAMDDVEFEVRFELGSEDAVGRHVGKREELWRATRHQVLVVDGLGRVPSVPQRRAEIGADRMPQRAELRGVQSDLFDEREDLCNGQVFAHLGQKAVTLGDELLGHAMRS